MDAATIVALLSETATQLREDLELMNTGVIKCECFGADVTEQHMGRMAVRLAKIEAVIDAHRNRVVHDVAVPASVGATS